MNRIIGAEDLSTSGKTDAASATILPLRVRERRGFVMDLDAADGFVRLTAYTCTGWLILDEYVAVDFYTQGALDRVEEALYEICPPTCDGTCGSKRTSAPSDSRPTRMSKFPGLRTKRPAG